MTKRLCLVGRRYPLFLIEDLDAKRPNKMQLLGKNIVVWQAPDGSWSALEDLCPHRLAPLSGMQHSISTPCPCRLCRTVGCHCLLGESLPGASCCVQPALCFDPTQAEFRAFCNGIELRSLRQFFKAVLS